MKLFLLLFSLSSLIQPCHAGPREDQLRLLIGEMTVLDPNSLNKDDQKARAAAYRRRELRIAKMPAFGGGVEEISLDLIEVIASEFRFGPARVKNWGMMMPEKSAFRWFADLKSETQNPCPDNLFPGFESRVLAPGERPPFPFSGR